MKTPKIDIAQLIHLSIARSFSNAWLEGQHPSTISCGGFLLHDVPRDRHSGCEITTPFRNLLLETGPLNRHTFAVALKARTVSTRRSSAMDTYQTPLAR